MDKDFVFSQAGFYESIIAYTVTGIAALEYKEDIEDFRYIMCNDAYYKHNSFIPSDVTGKLLTEVFPLCRDNGMFDKTLTVVKTGEPMQSTLSYYNPVRGNVYQSFQFFRLNRNCVVTMFNDITDIKNSEEAVQLEQIKYSQTLNSLASGVITTDSENRITLINQYAANMLGVKAEDVIGKLSQEVYSLEKTNSSNLINTLLDDFETQTVVSANGIKKLVVHRRTNMVDARGVLKGYVYSFEDVSSFVKTQEELMYMNYHDMLTGFYNRMFLFIYLSRNDVKSGIGVITADINGLAKVNDIEGVEAGDKLLKQCAQAFKESVPDNSILIRFGEDDFIALVYLSKDMDLVKIALNIKNGYSKNCGLSNSSLSIGTSILGGDTDNIQEAIRISQDRMNSQKILDGKSIRSSALLSLLATLQVKSHETEEHAQRLNRISHVFAQKMQLNENDLNQLALLSVLHDVGKIGVPEFVLDKPEKLTDEEWKIMRNHSNLGDMILLSTPELKDIAPLVRAHHERWDGKGYPDGLKGTETPLLSRIISIVDSYDAMVNDRIYRKALSMEQAIEEIKKNAGTQFDLELVEVFLSVIHEV